MDHAAPPTPPTTRNSRRARSAKPATAARGEYRDCALLVKHGEFSCGQAVRYVLIEQLRAWDEDALVAFIHEALQAHDASMALAVLAAWCGEGECA